MKRRSLWIYFFVLINLGVISCDNETPLDYRTQYCGDYQFESYYYSCVRGVCSSSDKILYEGNVQIDQETDSTLLIIYAPDDSGGATCNNEKVFGSQLIPTMKENGVILYSKVVESCGPRAGFEGWFINSDSIYFHAWNNSNGQYWGQHVSGKRLNK